MRKIVAGVMVMVLACFAVPEAKAKQAGIILLPTRIVLGPKDRNVTVTVKNNGDATGVYRVELVDIEMPEKGALKELPESKPDPYSAKSMLRISPRQVTLKADESQSVRIMVRKPRNLEDGEYRTHLKVKLIEDNLMEEEEKASNQDVVIQVKPKFSLIIPIIIREGETEAKVAIANPVLERQKTPVLGMTLERSGNRSVMGDVDVVYHAPDGKQLQLQHFAGLAIYRPTPKRYVSVPLEVPNGVTLKGGKLQITYKAQEKEGGGVLAETFLPL